MENDRLLLANSTLNRNGAISDTTIAAEDTINVTALPLRVTKTASQRDDADPGHARNSYTTPMWDNPDLASEVRRALAEKRLTVEAAREKTGLSISVLNQLRHGRSVRIESLRKWAEAMDGPESFTKWLALASARPESKASLRSSAELSGYIELDPQVRDVAENLIQLPPHQRLALSMVASALAESQNPDTTHKNRHRSLLQEFKHTNVRTPQEGTHRPVYSVSYLGPDSPGIMASITDAIREMHGSVLEGDSLARAGQGVVFVRFLASTINTDDLLQKTRAALQDIVGTSDFSFVLHEETDRASSLYRFGIYLRLVNEVGSLARALELLSASGANITDIRQRIDPAHPDEGYAILAIELKEPGASQPLSFAVAQKRVSDIKDKLRDVDGTLECTTEYLGQSHLLNGGK